MLNTRPNRIYYLLASVLVVVLSILVELNIYMNPMVNTIDHVPSMVDGLYATEKSDFLQVNNIRENGMFRWSRPTVLFKFWPAPATSRLFTTTYISATSDIRILTDQLHIGILPTTPVTRIATILTPASSPFEVYLQTVTPHKSENESRWLGFVFLDVSWQATHDLQVSSAMLLWYLFSGMGLSTLLSIIVVFVINQPPSRAILAGLGYVVIMWIVGYVEPWVTVAMQPTVQSVLIIGIFGILLQNWLQRFLIPDRHAYFIIFAVWIISFLCFFSPKISSDGVGYYAYVRSFFIDGNFDFANEFNRTLSPFPYTPKFPVYAPTGYTINPWSIGPALIWTPFWLIGHGITLLTGGFTFWESDGYSEPYIVFTCFASSIAGLFTMYTLHLLLRRWFTPTVALITSIGVFLGTNLLYYANYAGSYPHSLSAFFATLCVFYTLHIYDDINLRWWHWLRLGICTGLLVLIYWMNVIICLFPAALFLQRLWQLYNRHDILHTKKYVVGISIACIAGIVTLLPQFAVWYVMYEQFFSVYKPDPAKYITIFGTKISAGILPTKIHLVEYFLGPTYGLLWWTPLYVLGLGGCWFFMRINKTIALWSAVVVCCYILYNSAIFNWYGSGAFGMRRMTTVLPFVAIGAAYCTSYLQRTPHLVALLWSSIIGWEMRLLTRYLHFNRERIPHNFLNDLSASLLSPDISSSVSIAYPINLSWWLQHLISPSIEGLIMSSCMAISLCGIFLISRRYLLPHITSDHT